MNIKHLLPLILFGIIISTFGQKPSMEFTFTAKNYIYYIPLDSIHIENITQGCDTTIYYPDTVFVLNYLSSTGNYLAGGNNYDIILKNYPNPFKEKTEISLLLSGKQHINITVRDIYGKVLFEYLNTLLRGEHSFTFYPGNENCYLLTVNGDQTSRTIKMISSINGTSFNGKCKLVYKTINNNDFKLKAGQIIDGFVFNLGDELKYTGYTYLGGISIIDSPVSNQTYELQYTGKPCPGIPIVTDIEGNTYNTVLIGEQCWMKENLKTTTYRNGTPIPNVTDSLLWGTLTTGAYVWYDNDISWKDLYGALYNWYVGIDTNGVCPQGWHVPSQEEWMALTDFIGGWISPFGDMLKSCRQVNSPLGGDCLTSEHPRWEAYGDYYGTGDFGFCGLPGGQRIVDDGSFIFLGKIGLYWSATENAINSARLYGLFYNYDVIYNGYRHKNDGFSVRCLKD